MFRRAVFDAVSVCGILCLILSSQSAFLAAQSASPTQTAKEEKNSFHSDYERIDDVPYYSDIPSDSYDKYKETQCRLDTIYPKNRQKRFASVLWFHGGGLAGGRRYFPPAFKRLSSFRNGDLAIVAVDYRLSPNVAFPGFIEDAAAAVTWVLRHIEEYGGDPDKVFVSGGSAGAYLAAMIGAHPRWLAEFGADPHDLAGLIPVSGQMTTHFHVKELLGYQGSQFNPVIDANAPLGGLRKDFPPVFLITGDRKIEWLCRVEENELMAASLRALGAPLVLFSENEGFTHGISGMGDDITDELVERLDAFIRDAVEFKRSTKNP